MYFGSSPFSFIAMTKSVRRQKAAGAVVFEKPARLRRVVGW
jgi:hypothetical protein